MSLSEEKGRADRRILSVGALLVGLQGLFEDRVGSVWVVGEISNLHRAASGHSYFTLKDEEGQIRAVLFRGAAGRIPFEIEEGLEVVVLAEVSIYAARGDLQLIIRRLEPRGQGALQLAFEQLRGRLAAEGLFDEDRKRDLPNFPRRVGIVTSTEGAAIRDVIEVSAGQFPTTPLLISPSRVQGEGAELEIASALRRLESVDDIDVVLLVRGGGSLEDLQAFNREAVARAIAECEIPIVSGVGHETDVTIADLVADARVPTPSAAAMLALPDRESLELRLEQHAHGILSAIRERVAGLRVRLHHERNALRVLTPTARLLRQQERFRVAARSLGRIGRGMGEGPKARFEQIVVQLNDLSPLRVLGRGYALVRRATDGVVLRRFDEVARGEPIDIRLAQGWLRATVDSGGLDPDSEL